MCFFVYGARLSFRFKQTELILTENDEQTKNDGSQLKKLSAKTEMRWKGNGIDKMVFWLNQIHLSNTNKNSPSCAATQRYMNTTRITGIMMKQWLVFLNLQFNDPSIQFAVRLLVVTLTLAFLFLFSFFFFASHLESFSISSIVYHPLMVPLFLSRSAVALVARSAHLALVSFIFKF